MIVREESGDKSPHSKAIITAEQVERSPVQSLRVEREESPNSAGQCAS